MKRMRYSEAKIIATLKEREAGASNRQDANYDPRVDFSTVMT